MKYAFQNHKILTGGKEDSNKDSRRSRVSLSLKSSRLEKASSMAYIAAWSEVSDILAVP